MKNAKSIPKKLKLDISMITDIKKILDESFRLFEQGNELTNNLSLFRSSMDDFTANNMRDEITKVYRQSGALKYSIVQKIEAIHGESIEKKHGVKLTDTYFALQYNEDFTVATLYSSKEEYEKDKNKVLDYNLGDSELTEGQQNVQKFIAKNIEALVNGEQEVYDMVVEYTLKNFEEENGDKTYDIEKMKNRTRKLLDEFVSEYISRNRNNN